MLTLTLRHARGDGLEGMLHGLAEAYRGLTRGKPWKGFESAAGLAHSVRRVECTRGPSGWHPHLHVLWVRDETAPVDKRWLSLRWRDMVHRYVGEAHRPSMEHGVDVRTFRGETAEGIAAAYLAKSASASRKAAAEVSSGATKKGAGLSVWDVADRGGPLWREWVEATKGRRAMTVSRSLAPTWKAALTREGLLVPYREGESRVPLTHEQWSELRTHPEGLTKALSQARRGEAVKHQVTFGDMTLFRSAWLDRLASPGV